jgi:hypothetical protein
MRLMCALLLACTVAGSRLCEGAYNAVQRELHQERIRRVLDPIQDGALMLSMESSAPADILLAHRLIRVHDNYTAACHHHQWQNSLTHKLCASLIRWHPHLQTGCGSDYNTGRFYGCVCTGLSVVIEACRAHVRPYDEQLCEQLRLRECTDVHPMGGLCARARRTRSTVQGPHAEFRTEDKHNSWEHSRARQEAVQLAAQATAPIKSNALDARHNTSALRGRTVYTPPRR